MSSWHPVIEAEGEGLAAGGEVLRTVEARGNRAPRCLLFGVRFVEPAGDRAAVGTHTNSRRR